RIRPAFLHHLRSPFVPVSDTAVGSKTFRAAASPHHGLATRACLTAAGGKDLQVTKDFSTGQWLSCSKGRRGRRELRTRCLVFARQPSDELGRRHHRLDRADALAAAPDVLP